MHESDRHGYTTMGGISIHELDRHGYAVLWEASQYMN